MLKNAFKVVSNGLEFRLDSMQEMPSASPSGAAVAPPVTASSSSGRVAKDCALDGGAQIRSNVHSVARQA